MVLNPIHKPVPLILGMPGVLPVLNKEAVRMAIKFGLGINAQIAPRIYFCAQKLFLS